MARLLLRHIRPLWLREKLFYHARSRFVLRADELFENARLEFAPDVRLRLVPTDVGHQVIAWTGFYELAVSRRVAALARLGGLMVDVGANYGYYSCLRAGARPENRVTAYEVVPENLRALRQSLSDNGLSARVRVREVAVGREAGLVSFQFGPAGQTGQGGLVSRPDSAATSVRITTLDDELADDETVDVLKIDVEGADTWVLEGAGRLLSSHRVRNVFFEQFPQRMDELGIAHDAARRFLRQHGYRVEEISSGEFHAVPASR